MKIFAVLLSLFLLTGCSEAGLSSGGDAGEKTQFYFPSEDKGHEGTWLNWPHHYTYGLEYRQELEPIWIQMADSLHEGENIHIIAYNEKEQERIASLLREAGLNMDKVDFTIAKTDDVWSRDTGPMFVMNAEGKAFIADFAFDGWGGKTPCKHDDAVPQAVATAKNFPILSIPDFVLEGGSVELDGSGTAMICKSSVVSKNRNSGKSIAEAEAYLMKYLGAANFIWLEGVLDEDITDAHIDGIARFYDDKTLLTVSEDDFLQLYEGIQVRDYKTLLTAVNVKGEPYKVLELPMTAKNVEGLDYKGSYLNYYVGNKVVLLPVYADENDTIAVDILSRLYQNKEIIPINVTPLYQYGGMLHCVTQQQPQTVQEENTPKGP